ncbi:MAG: cell division ATPase MinD [Candidatus Aenigmarchaeota archaeon]|nr:cell division ATPase MinD [Candidatus Aenigmarchaeota archaeon]
MSRIISVVSGKGGVGKTTLTSNLGIVLNKLGKKTLVVDGNITTPDISLHLGIPLYPITIHDVLRGDAHISEAIYDHPTGLSIVPGSISIDDLNKINMDKLSESLNYLKKQADIILLDSPAGLGKESLKSIEVANDIIIVTNPNMPSIVEALKIKEIAERMNKNILGVVINRVNNKKSELSEKEIKNMLELPILTKIPEDSVVPLSIGNKIPVVHFDPFSPSSKAINKFGADLVGKEFEMKEFGFFQRIMTWLRR